MSTPRSHLLIQLDGDKHPSVFDRVVALDAPDGADHVLSYGNVTADDVEAMVHGAIFTRGVDDLKSTAIFVGGSDVSQGQLLFERVQKTFFGPMRVSVMLDANGANTTAVAAVLSAAKHVTLKNARVLNLGGTGPVGQRIAYLLANQGAHVTLASRSLDRAQKAAAAINKALEASHEKSSSSAFVPITAVATADEASLTEALKSKAVVIAAGAAGVCLLPEKIRTQAKDLKVAVDLNAVPPLGIEAVEVTAKAKQQNGQIVYGAIGVGGLKMKIHKAAITRLFQSNDQVLDAESIYKIGEEIVSA